MVVVGIVIAASDYQVTVELVLYDGLSAAYTVRSTRLAEVPAQCFPTCRVRVRVTDVA